ncbi:MAG TPA: hypothetical protein VG650_02700 [Mycobacteriales bacterium]|nr:hypothetical protein [Mycobacteriales bacterium]
MPILALLGGGLVGVLPALPAAAAPATTVWTLVTRTCTANEVPAGEACFDGAGHAQDYNTVTSATADGKTTGEHNSYEYELPNKIAAGQDNEVKLTANVDEVTDGGAHSRVCLQDYGQFGYTEAGDQCATTAEAGNGQNASASHTATLIPSNGDTGEIITLTIGFEEPGGYVNFDYKASNPVHHVKFGFSARVSRHEGGGKFTTINLVGSGSFDAVGPLVTSMPSTAEQGTAEVRFKEPNGDEGAARLVLRRARYFPKDHAADLTFRVSKSSLSCLPKARTFDISADNNKSLEFDMCGFSPRLLVEQDDVKVHVKSG